MKRISLFLLIVLIFSLMSVSTLSVTAQNSPPTVWEVSIVETNVTIGDTITIQANISYNYDFNSVQFYLYGPQYLWGNNDPIWIGGVNAGFNASTGYYVATYNVQEYDPEEITVGEIWLEDADVDSWWFSNPLIYDYQGPESQFSCNIVNVYNSNPDYEAPILQWYSVSSTEIQPGETVKISANITDDKSGVNNVWVSMNRDNVNSQYHWQDEQVDNFNLYYNSTTGLYEGSWNVYSYHQSGLYYISTIDIRDYSDNSRYYEVYSGAQNYLDPIYINVTNSNYQPLISEIYLEHTTVDIIESQTLFVNISNPDVDTSISGNFELAYEDPDYGLYFFGGIDFDFTDFNNETGLYEISFTSIYTYNSPPQNVDITIPYGWINPNGDSIQLQNGVTYDIPPFQITGELNDPLDVSISPENSEIYLGQESVFEIGLKNNEHYDMGGELFISVAGPDNFEYNTRYNISSYDELTHFQSVNFTTAGTYDIYAVFNTTEGAFDAMTQINVIQPPPEEIIVEVSPQDGTTEVGESVTFTVNMTSTYLQDLTGTVTLQLAGPEIVSKQFDVALYFLESETINFYVDFTEAGIYEFNATLIDSNGNYWWSNTYIWEVTGGDGQGEPANDTVVPQIQLPAFEFYITVVGFTSMLLITYQSRRKFD